MPAKKKQSSEAAVREIRRRARRLYEEAEVSAREAGYPLNATVACELAGRFELELGRQEEALRWLGAARHGYATWGACAKVEAMDEELPGLPEGRGKAPRKMGVGSEVVSHVLS